MEVNQLLETMKRERACGVVRFAIRDRPTQATTEGAVFAVAYESFEAAEVSLTDFRTGLVEIDAGLAGAVLGSLMRFDMAYSAPLMSIERAQELVALYLNVFQSDAQYYSNSTWNKNEFFKPCHFYLG
jgi:hypothetical protein